MGEANVRLPTAATTSKSLFTAMMAGVDPASHLPTQGDHSPGKPGKVREFQSGQGKVREN